MEPAIYDLKRLFALRQILDTLDSAAPPIVRLLFPAALSAVQRVGILCGSFNPLTLAHTELAERARREGQLDQVVFTLAKVTVDKEQITGLGLEDRLLLLLLYAQQHPFLGVALVNRGLYFEQARAFRALLGDRVHLSFIVGMDKLSQILDPRYYQDREAALRQLFTLASLIVANRGEMAHEEFNQLLDQPENRPYRPYIRFCPLPETIADLSATAVRAGIAAGHEISSQVPVETARFLAETQVYKPPRQSGDEGIDAYAVRLQFLNVLYALRSGAEQEVDFRRLLQVALAPDARGKILRSLTAGADLKEVLRSYRDAS